MPKDLKTGMFVGAVLAICATILISLFSSTVEQNRQQSGSSLISNTTAVDSKTDEPFEATGRRRVRLFKNEHIEPKLSDKSKSILLTAQVANKTETEADEEPPSPATSVTLTGQHRLHVVAEGETLTTISAHYYGTSGKFLDIYNANRDVIKDMNKLHPGMILKIPKD